MGLTAYVFLSELDRSRSQSQHMGEVVFSKETCELEDDLILCWLAVPRLALQHRCCLNTEVLGVQGRSVIWNDQRT